MGEAIATLALSVQPNRTAIVRFSIASAPSIFDFTNPGEVDANIFDVGFTEHVGHGPWCRWSAAPPIWPPWRRRAYDRILCPSPTSSGNSCVMALEGRVIASIPASRREGAGDEYIIVVGRTMGIIVVMSKNATGATWPQASRVPLLLLLMMTMLSPLTAEHL
jgi:hypothetical protein